VNASGKHQDRDGTDETAIREQIARYVRSVNEADTALAATVWDTTPAVSFIHPRGHDHGWDEVRSCFYERGMAARFTARTLTLHDLRVNILGDSAWIECDWTFEATRVGAGATRTKGRETQVFWRWGGEWRLMHVHYSERPEPTS
jgi:ketosteroid isomerase-like protein